MSQFVRLSACISGVPTGRICVEFGRGTSVELCRKNLNFIKIGQKYRALYGKTEVRFITAGDFIEEVWSERVSGY